MWPSLDLEHLRTVVAIAECGGFGKAATALHISQPALSQHVRLLERRLDRKLFEKDGRGMRFTVEGERLLAEARHILAVHDRALERLRANGGRTVVVGSSEHSAEQVLPEMLRALSDAFPGVATRFEIGRSTQLVESVAKGVIDLAFVLDTGPQTPGRAVADLPLHWYATPGWIAPDAEGVWPLVAFQEPCALRERALASLAAEGLRVDVTAQSTTLEGVLAGVRAGLGVALLPTAGGMPAGLERRGDLPAVGDVGLQLVTRRGLDVDIERAATEAGEAFFRRGNHLQLVPAEYTVRRTESFG